MIALAHSWTYPGGSLASDDLDTLEEVLRVSSQGGHRKIHLLLNSPGGDALAAERAINICRTYSKDGTFKVVVPRLAKSAATMICLGAEEIFMSPTSALGPIDPQIALSQDDGSHKWFAAHEIIESYEALFRGASRAKGNLEPYLQQLARFDAAEIRRIKSLQKLSENIAIRILGKGVMAGRKPSYIKRKMTPLLDPKYTIVHGRAIYVDEVSASGLVVRTLDVQS